MLRNKKMSTPPNSLISKKKKSPKKPSNKKLPKPSNAHSTETKCESPSNTPTQSPSRENFVSLSLEKQCGNLKCQKQAPPPLDLHSGPTLVKPQPEKYDPP